VKSLFRSPIVQGILGWLVAVYIELIIHTLRWRFENRAPVDEAMASPQGLLALFWHGRIAQALACRPLLSGKPRRVMISLSSDGEFIAKAAELLRIPPVRGSSGGSARKASKGGAAAFREALTFMRSGGVMILTPDGPRGPAEVLPRGAARLAQAAACPVFLMSLAARPALTISSWDRARIPLPFARGQVVLEGPLSPPADASDEALEATRADWQARMRAGQARAEALLQGQPT
jgi:lysophospholipid acyltransferase (LPLAT)-like uncharacterized protein